MVTSSQVPPLQDLVPFDTYGVLIRDEEIPGDELGVEMGELASQLTFSKKHI